MQKLKKEVKCWYSEKVRYKTSTCYIRRLGQNKTSQEPSKKPLSLSESCKDATLCQWYTHEAPGFCLDPRSGTTGGGDWLQIICWYL